MGRSHDHKGGRRQAYIEHCTEVLRQGGGRITKPRLALLESLADAERSLSPNDLVERIHHQRGMPEIDLVTVYRNLDSLAELGLVHKVGPEGEFVACAH